MDRYHGPALDYISDLDFDSSHPNIATTDPFDPFPASPFPATPSYAGSYQNSPYSGASDLHDFDQKDDALGLFSDSDPLVISRDEYSRDEYDPAAYDAPSSGGGLLMFDNDFMTNIDGPNVSLSVTPADDPSPAHSPAMYDHSSPASSAGRADSPASSVSSHPHSGGSHHTNAPNPSPRINFDTLRVDSPFMPNQQLPSSPPNKPRSPPQLLIPEGQEQAPPMINAPEGDGGVGPRLHIVPATPVGGGDPNQGHSNPFGQGSQQSASTAWQHDPSTSNAAQSSSYQPSFTFPAERPLINTGGNGGLPSSADDFLLPPSPSRIRSKSDTSARPPQWLSSGGMSLLPQNALDDRTHTVNLGDVLPPVSDLDRRHHQPAYASGPGLAPPGFGGQGFGLPPNNGLLSPDFNALRRAKSDAGRMTHRQVRSEDLRASPGAGLGFPPSPHQDFIRAAQTGPATQFLHPTEVARVAGGHHRRASSGSRERGWGGGHSARASPYPSPSASPARLVEPLPSVGGMGGMYGGGMGGMGMGMGMGGGMDAPYMSASASRASTPAAVAKPNVTTTATADASMKRRINDAKFVCPVPGCGSTFTRHFNLKGHMRSHNDEKPFQCKWPGCGKGFARQHDCKRHEQLHSNHRPFTCEGCKKPFARLDALNRHLRSEGGAGCAKTQEGAGGEGMDAHAHHQAPPELSLPGKMEPDVNGWGNAGFAGIVM